MGDMGEVFRDLRKYRKEKKEKNLESNITLLKKLNIYFVEYGTYHLGIKTAKGTISFYPSTGLWFYSKNPRKQRRGIRSLLKELGFAPEYVQPLTEM
ncbi:hypothetical protein [Rodentibacter pneumotropicus]|uniref:Uncharacterized protein n=1 Tax=Rodentibacter pneumotropicus TaxID=758 RepID=A0A4S2Q6U2_9PAST|nr:hypothetical protein [Rodentibacter pneumotropicus]THA09434.1 hypothetical protein D3M77_02160 [Rodentibacter pneumotropicus]THA12423.1 hypothetical protein D3M76_09990 [Rodentibacter pneumotropicus]